MEAAVSALAEAFARPEMFRRPVAGAREGLRALAHFGVALAVVSNASGQVEGSLRDAGLCQTGPGDGVTVGAVIDSHVVGVAKPDPRIFEIALDAVGIHPSRAVHVGDVVGADVVGAEAAGIRPLHMDPYGLCGDHSHAHVASMADVAELVVA
jgi:putative hydrolase of the HAD superfamily